MTGQDLQEAADARAMNVNNPETAYNVHAELTLDDTLCVKTLRFSEPGLTSDILRRTFRTWYDSVIGYEVGPDIRLL